MPRRGENIYKRRDGRWEGRYKNGCKPDGSAKYSSVYGKTYFAVKSLLSERKTAISHDNECHLTVQNIFELWLEKVRLTVKESTFENYRIRYEKHILPALGHISYNAVTTEILNSFISQKLSEGLSAKYVCDIGMILKSAFRFIHERYKCLDKSEFMVLPKNKKVSEKKLLNEIEQRKLKEFLLKNISPSNTGILLSLYMGLRVGELCALKWEDVNFEKKIISVRHTLQRIKNRDGASATKIIVTDPKSFSSLRDIPIPDFLIPILKQLRCGAENYILSGSTDPIEPRTMQNRFKNILKKLNITNVCFHAMRHMFATNCIALGFDVKTLSEILGHSSIKITLELYVHSSMERKIECMKLLSQYFSDS